MASPSAADHEPPDLEGWETDDSVLAELPGKEAEFLASRRVPNVRAKLPESAEQTADPPPQAPVVVGTETMEKVTFERAPDRFLRCLALLKKGLELRQDEALKNGRPATTEELTSFAIQALRRLPIDIHANAGFLAQFVAKAIGEALSTTEIDKFQLNLKRAKPNLLPERLTVEEDDGLGELAGEDASGDASMAHVSGWGKNAIDVGLGTITFDEQQAVLEDVQQLPGVGKALFSKEGQFRTSFWKSATGTAIVAGFALLLALLLTFIYRTKPEPPPEPSLVDEALYESPDLDKVDMALDGYLRADTWYKQLAYIRHPAILESKMEAHYAKHPYQRTKGYSLLKFNLEILGGVPQVLCLVEIEPTKQQRAILMEIDHDGKYLVDWEYAELWQETAWEDLLNRTSTEPATMLVILKPGQYYNFRYADKTQFQCWELIDPSEKGITMFGYTSQKNPVAKELSELLKNRRVDSRMSLFTCILKLAHPPNAEDPLQLEILEVVEPSPLRSY